MAIAVQVLTRAQAAHPGALLPPAGQRWAMLSDPWFDATSESPGLDRHGLFGCACCAGNLALRVTLGRLIRRGGYARVLIVVADESHRAGVLAVLGEAQFAPHLTLLPA